MLSSSKSFTNLRESEEHLPFTLTHARATLAIKRGEDALRLLVKEELPLIEKTLLGTAKKTSLLVNDPNFGKATIHDSKASG